MKRTARVLLVLIVAIVLVVYGSGRGWLGEGPGPGTIVGGALPGAGVTARAHAQRTAAEALLPDAALHFRGRQILFGDLHVHTTYSADAFSMSLPLGGGDGAHPIADACDFARYCSALDFWSINDHAETSTPRRWRETVASVRQCNAIAGDTPTPDLVSFLGWEWTQMGTTPDDHYGHKNVVLRDLDDDAIPARPIASVPTEIQTGGRDLAPGLLTTLGMGLLPLLERDASLLDLNRFMSEMMDVATCPSGVPSPELPADCREQAATPGELFAKLDELGLASMVIPHGTTWGIYTPPGSSWQKQLSAAQHDPDRQRLIEVMSGHGSAEEYREWRAVDIAPDGTRSCPAPSDGYLPACWRAGEIIRERCLADDESSEECEERAVAARQHFADVRSVLGHLTVPGYEPDEWLDAGQCNDCFLPAFNHRPLGSVQHILALRSFADDGGPDRFRFGFLSSSDNHSARPGTGYKEFARTEMTEARLSRSMGALGGGYDVETEARSRAFEGGVSFASGGEIERFGSFFYPGGLVAVHADGRDRESIWSGLERREVYATSGPRILLWFDLLNPPDSAARPMLPTLPMGSEVVMRDAPIFQVRAVGSLEQRPGCSSLAEDALGAERVERLCRGECYRPSEERRLITRIEIVRIRPQVRPDEPIGPLVEDPWRTFACQPDPAGCVATFTDPDFGPAGRDAVYYARAIEAPSLQINADNLRCTRDEAGRCTRVDPCRGGADDDCLAEDEERAWSSPIFVDHARSGAPKVAGGPS